MSEANTGVTEGASSADASAAPIESAAPAAVPSNPTPDTSAADPAAADASVTPPVLDENGQPVPPKFTPDFKFKVKDKEFEIDDWARGLATDEETYAKLKRVWERHTGLDEVIQGREALKQQIQSFEPQIKEYQQVTQRLNEISHYYNSGDMDSFFESLQIPFEKVFEYVKGKHEASQLPPHVQQQLEKARQAGRDAYNYNQRLQTLEQAQSDAQTQATLSSLDQAIASKAGQIATKYAELNGGNPDAFRQYVVIKGRMMTQQLGRNATVDEVVDSAVRDFSHLAGQPPVAATAAMPSQAPGAPAAPPVIPVVKAGNQSPVRQPVKTYEELLKRSRGQ